MGFKQTGNGGCHTRESGIDGRLLLCALQERTGAIMNIIHYSGFTTQALSDETAIHTGKKMKPATFTAIKYFTLFQSHRHESTPSPACDFRFFAIVSARTPGKKTTKTLQINYSNMEVYQGV